MIRAVVQTSERGAATAGELRRPRRRRQVWTAVAVVAVLLAAALLVRLGAQERGGPTHTSFISLPNGAPATLYVPQRKQHGEFPLPPSPGRRR